MIVVALVALAVVVVVVRQSPEPEAIATPTTVATVPTTVPTTPPTTPPPPDTAPPETAPPGPPVPHPAGPRYPNVVATATKPSVAVHDAPNGRFVVALTSPLPFSRMPVTFLVLDDPGTGWLHVALRTRPNGSTGWIQKTDVALTTNDWSIDIDVTAHWITVYKGADVWLEASVVTGTAYTPTPIGDFFLAEAVWEANKWGAHGPFTYGLSAHSEVLMTFDGGDGQIGIHGTNAPQLRGTDSSNGCIRLSNEDITRMAQNLPMGVPVHIHT